MIVLSGDHAHKMDYARMLRVHRERGADMTLAAIEVPLADARRLGVLSVDPLRSRDGFHRETEGSPAIPGSSDTALASMGIYIFTTEVLLRALEADAAQPTSHDFGKDIIPALIKEVPTFAYRFYDENKKSSKIWRDIDAGRLLRSQHGFVPCRSGIQPVRSRVADADVSAAGTAREVRVRRERPALR